jgi:uncharacterized tellurite resistance protein B-like protein
MFPLLKNFLKALDSTARQPVDLRLAVAVLLLEAAQKDGEFSPEERAAIERLLTERFGLSAAERAELMAEGERTNADLVQLFPYTSTIVDGMTPDERVGLIEMLWEVAYADGVLDAEEDTLIRRLAMLIYVDDRERMLARQRVLARMEEKPRS